MSIMEEIDALAAKGGLHGLTIWPCRGGYQVSLRTDDKSHSWRIKFADKPSDGVAAVLAADNLDDAGAVMPWPLNQRKAHEPEMLAPPAVDEPPGLGFGDVHDFDEPHEEHGEPPMSDEVLAELAEGAGIFD